MTQTESSNTIATLLPCPFCGGEAYSVRSVNGSQMFFVGCSPCGVAFKAAWFRGEEHPTKDIAGAWNQRAPVVSSSATGFPDWCEADHKQAREMARSARDDAFYINRLARVFLYACNELSSLRGSAVSFPDPNPPTTEQT